MIFMYGNYEEKIGDVFCRTMLSKSSSRLKVVCVSTEPNVEGLEQQGSTENSMEMCYTTHHSCRKQSSNCYMVWAWWRMDVKRRGMGFYYSWIL